MFEDIISSSTNCEIYIRGIDLIITLPDNDFKLSDSLVGASVKVIANRNVSAKKEEGVLWQCALRVISV